MSVAQSRAGAGWYPDPQMAGTQRYWDGQQWTGHVAPAGPEAQVRVEQGRTDNQLVIAGLVLAVLFPLAGFIIGCILVGRPYQTGNGVLCMVGSLVMACFWLYLIA